MSSILIVEDDLSLQRLYEMMLKTFGYTIIGKANNGKEAIEIFTSSTPKPDIILMDHRMPIKNGIETAIEILNLNSHSKIIFTSADNSVKKQALSIGATSFLEKPFNLEKLHNEIEKILASAS
ncbi:MAG: response regulator [Candidatus Hodarchaeota archaeon]